MEAKHTPGPWIENSFCGSMGGIGLREVYAETPTGPSAICRVAAERQDANAALIAAAPDLLAACEALLLDPTPRADAVRVARAAIARARGTP